MNARLADGGAADVPGTTTVGDGLVLPRRCVANSGDHKGRPYGLFHGRYALILAGGLAALTTDAQEPTSVEELPAALVEAAGGADRFERETVLYRYLAGTGHAEVVALLDTVDGLPEASFRAAVSGPLYARLAHFDAQAAVDHVLARSGNPSDLVIVIRAWAHVDLAAATAHASTLRPLAKWIAARTILELDLSAAQRDFVLDELGGGENASLEAMGVISAVDDTWAAAWSKALQADPDDRRHLVELAAAWAASDPLAAMEVAAQLPTLKDVAVQKAVVRAWAADDPRGPIEWLVRYAEAFEANFAAPRQSLLPLDLNLAPLAMQMLAEHDPDGAVSLLQEVPKPMYRRALLGLATSFAADHPERAITLYESQEDPAAKRDILGVMASDTTWDSEKLDWLASLRAQPEDVERVVGTAYLEDRTLLLGWLAELDDPDRQAAGAGAIVDDEADRDAPAAWRWAGEFETERDALRARVYRRWHASDEPAATRAILDMPDRESRDRVASNAIEWLLDAEGPQDSSAAERLFKVIDSEALRGEAARRFVDYFVDIGGEREADRYRRLSTGGDR